MAEQFALQEGVGQGGAIHFHEIAVTPGAVAVNGLRDELLPGAGFAYDEDRRVGPRHLLDGVEDFLHDPGIAHDPGGSRAAPQVVHLLNEAPVFQSALDLHLQLVVGPLLDGLHGSLHGAEGGHDDHRGVLVDVPGAPEDLQAIASRHFEVGHHEVEPLTL